MSTPAQDQAPAADPAPETTSALAAEPSTYDPTAPYVQGGVTYVPGTPPPVAKLPGDPGYVPRAD